MVAGTVNRRRKSPKKSLWHIDKDAPTEMMVFCPSCKALEIVRFEGRSLVPTRKFTQRAGRVYHSCETKLPCRVHRFGGRSGLGPTDLRPGTRSHPIPGNRSRRALSNSVAR